MANWISIIRNTKEIIFQLLTDISIFFKKKEMSKIEVGSEVGEANRLAWKNYALKREFSKLKIELPKELLPEPKSEIEAIKMKGYFEKKQIKIAIIGMQNRLLELLAILHNFNSFSIVIAAVSNIPENIRSIIAERYNDPPYVEKISDLLTKPDIEWVFIGSLYFDVFNQASASLLAGKHVFCEKPICFRFFFLFLFLFFIFSEIKFPPIVWQTV